MDQLLTEELHHIPFEIDEILEKSCLLSCSLNGLVFVARKNDLAIFSTKDYFRISSSFSQRKDKPLTLFKPNLCVPTRRRVTWLSANCSGSLLLVAYNSSIELLNIVQLSAKPPHGFLGDTLNLPIEVGSICDLAWNPVDKHRFALVTASETVHMFTVDPLQKPHFNLVGCLPSSMHARCLSWSPKGKQLALACTGACSDSTVATTNSNSTTIVQVDHDLKVKRVIPVAVQLKDRLKSFTEPRPIDILWTSSYCFLLGVEDSNASSGIQLVYITAPPKSDAKVEQLREFGSLGSTRFHYQMHLLSNSATFASVTWSPDAEECHILDVPAITAATESPSANSLPKLIKSLPLPTDSFPIAMDIGAIVDSPEPTLLIVGLLANGAVFAFKVFPSQNDQTKTSNTIFSGFRARCGSADKPPQMPSVTVQSSNSESSPTAFAQFEKISQPSDNTTKSNVASLFNKDGTLSGFLTSPGATGINFTPAPSSAPVSHSIAVANTTSMAGVKSGTQPIIITASLPNASFESPFAKLSSTGTAAVVTTTTTSRDATISAPTKALSSTKSSTPSGRNAVVQPPSISKAAVEFSKALESQKETSARAWSHLQDVFEGNSKNLQMKDDVKGSRRGVWDIEQSLKNMDNFLRVLGEITAQLQKASQLSMNDLTASTDFLDRLSSDFDAFHHRLVSEKQQQQYHLSTTGVKLDPESAAMLSSLRRKSRAAENFLVELEDQVESLSLQLESHAENVDRLRGRNKSRFSVDDSGSPLSKIQATIATNSRLIKCERSRLELISRIAGISLSPGNNSRNLSTPAASLGSSAVCVDREQRDARLYRLLCAEKKSDIKAKGGKSDGTKHLPVSKASSTMAEILQLMRKTCAAEKEVETVQQLKPLKKPLAEVPLKATEPQMNSPGHQKNVEITGLLASAASVPSVTLTNEEATPKTYSAMTADTVSKPSTVQDAPTLISKPSSTPSSIGNTMATTVAQKSMTGVPSVSKPPMFVPSTVKCLSSPTQVNPIAAPTTKVFGAPMGDSVVDNFKPLAPRVPSLTSASETAPSDAAASSRKPPVFASAPITTSTEVSTTTVSKPLVGGLFGPGPLNTPATETASQDKTASTTVATLAPNLFGSLSGMFTTAAPTPPAVSIASPSKSSINLSGNIGATVAMTQPIQLFGASTVSAATTAQPSQIFDSKGFTTAVSRPDPVFKSVGTASANQPEPMSEISNSTAASTSQPSQLFGTVGSFATAPPVQVFGKPIFSPPGQSTSLFGQSVAPVSSSSGGLFGQSPASNVGGFFGGSVTQASSTQAVGQPLAFGGAQASSPFALSPPSGSSFGAPLSTTSGQPQGLFGQPPVIASAQPGGLLGQSKPPSSGGLFGQPISAKPGGLFGQSPTQSGGLFGQPTSIGGLFGQSPVAAAATTMASTGGLFGQLPTNPAVASGQPPITPANQMGGLFGAISPSTGGGLFGSSKFTEGRNEGLVEGSVAASTSSSLQHISNVNNLFAMSNFGLGSTSAPAPTNVFGKLSSDATSSPLNNTNMPARNLFGPSPSAPSTATNFTTEPKPGGLFGPSTLTNVGLFGSQMSTAAASTTTTTTSGGGLFSGSGGLFSNSPSSTGGGPLFGGPAFSTGTSGGLFSPNSGNSGLFGSSLTSPPGTAGAPNFGAPASFGGIVSTPTCVASGGAGGLFASLSNSSSGVSFGVIANAAVQQPSTPIFGSSPSFTQRRA